MEWLSLKSAVSSGADYILKCWSVTNQNFPCAWGEPYSTRFHRGVSNHSVRFR